ncbi:MAG: hypothetical protein KDM63_02580 [Verrucomicrobiae bacterium]|nr:hypothetical protein [Verrucomicrobiae bacterium]
MPQEEFIARAVEIHGNRYDYSLVDYRATDQPVVIICPKHKEFRQTPNAHLAGKGCAACNESTGERAVARFLKQVGVEFVRQHVIEPRPHPYRYDFFVPTRNLLIEFHGNQHYEPSDYFGGERAFRRTQERDREKEFLAAANGLDMLVIAHYEFDRIPEILRRTLGFSS